MEPDLINASVINDRSGEGILMPRRKRIYNAALITNTGMNDKPDRRKVVILDDHSHGAGSAYGDGGARRPAVRLIDILVIAGLLGITLIAIVSGLLLIQKLESGSLSPPLSSGADTGITTVADAVPDEAGNSSGPSFTPGATTQIVTLVTASSASVKNAAGAVNSDRKTVDSGMIYRTYTWNFKNESWIWQGNFSQSSYLYYRGKAHNRENNYAEYVLSDYDRQTLSDIVTKFKNVGTANGFNEYDNVMNIAAFVQSLHYSSDKVTTGYDEYPRYPIETLVDNGGDCEDTAILTAAMVDAMGYSVVLVRFPGHMGVGVEGSGAFNGTYFEKEKSRFYYLETTGGAHWGLGELPKEFRYSQATLLPLVQRARMDMICTAGGVQYDNSYLYLNENCTIRNIGVGTAKNPRLHISAAGIVGGVQHMWQPEANLSLGDYPEGASGSSGTVLRIPLNQTSRVRFYLSGENFDPVDLLSDPMIT